MKSSDGETLFSLSTPFSWHLVALVAGLALAAGAATFAGALEEDAWAPSGRIEKPEPPPVEVPRLPATTARGNAFEAVYIVVDSEEEAAALRSAVAAYVAALPELAVTVAGTHVVAVETASDHAQLLTEVRLASLELASVGSTVRVVDFREAP